MYCALYEDTKLFVLRYVVLLLYYRLDLIYRDKMRYVGETITNLTKDE